MARFAFVIFKRDFTKTESKNEKMIKSSAFLVFAFLLISGTGSTYYDDRPHLDYLRSDVHARSYYHPFWDQALQFARRLSESDQLNPRCRSGLNRLIAGIENNEFWALKCKCSSQAFYNLCPAI